MRRGAVAATVLVLGAGCGGGDDPDPAADYVEAAEKICRDGKLQADRLVARSEGDPPPAIAREGRRLLARYNERLADLEPPDHLRARHQDMLQTIRDLEDIGRQGRRLGPEAGILLRPRYDREAAKLARIMRELRLDGCI